MAMPKKMTLSIVLMTVFQVRERQTPGNCPMGTMTSYQLENTAQDCYQTGLGQEGWPISQSILEVALN